MDAPQTPVIRLCDDIAAYVEVAETLLASNLCGKVPALGGGRDAARLAGLFPDIGIEPADGRNDGLGFSEELAGRLLDSRGDDGDEHRLLVAEAGSAESIPAILYALATGRRVRLAADAASLEGVAGSASSLVVAGRAELFGKDRLRRLLGWAQDGAAVPRQLGILTGRDLLQIADLVAKLLLARRSSGRRDAAGGDFEMIGAHGNEIHLGHGDQVLCGRSPDALGSAGDGFDCGAACPHRNRQAADRIRAGTVFLISCDGFTPIGGIAPNAFSLLFRLLDGPACAILAPYKHVQANENLLVGIQAMARSGYALGRIASVINGCANRGSLPDPAYLVLGDPELTAAAAKPSEEPPPLLARTDRGIFVRTEGDGTRSALSLRVAAEPSGGPLAVLPLSEGLRTDDTFFAIGASGDPATVDLTVFRDRPLPQGPIELALVEAGRPDAAAIAAAVRRLDKCRLATAILGEDAGIAAARQALWQALSTAAAFPRPVESILSQNRMLHFDRLIREHFAILQHSICDALMAALGRRRLWISQEYGDLFARIFRAGPADDGDCPHCGGAVTTWAYEDPLTGLDRRHVPICCRCGIIADGPADAALSVGFETIGRFESPNETLTIRLTNLGDLPLRTSLAVQLNEWAIAGLGGTGCREDFELAPGETCEHRATLEFPAGFPDDILSVQLFLVTEALDLMFFSQKVRSVIRPRAGAAAPARPAIAGRG